MKTTILVLLVSLLFTSCGSVKPIDLHDPLVPLEARKLVADAQDSIAVARVRRDEAAMTLQKRKTWRADALDRDRWRDAASELVDRLEAMADNHVDVARIELERAEARIRLADAKCDLVTARTAVRHDLATYDLERLGERVDKRRAMVREIEARLADQQVDLERATRAFWKRYAAADFSDGSPLFVTLEK